MKLRNPLDLVTILICKDPDPKKLVVHKDFACHHWPVFEAAFKSDLVEGQTQTYRLEENQEGTVRLLVLWLYTQTLDTCQHENPDDDVCKVDEDLCLAELWVLADKLLMPKLQNHTIREIVRLRRESGRSTTVCLNYIYANTSKGSPLRALLEHHCVCMFRGRFATDMPTTQKGIPMQCSSNWLAS